MNPNSPFANACFYLVVGFAIGSIFAGYMDNRVFIKPLQDEAVKRGLGEWKIDTSNSPRTFVWKKQKPEIENK